ncbi:nectin-3-like protein isoform X3 [Xiphophorus couchianus]|uniref:nectin-3-like protein isoform X3 n=1 Tax=Xiphophorus couchianus TaxID=32473 RepID=UPI001016B244|nr:nectin-3-like protein isoform X3 [Xiphophorus couchianus]
METRPTNRRTVPNDGMRLLTSFFILCGAAAGVSSNQVVVPDKVNAVLGKNITLGCRILVEPNLSLTQVSWERRLPSGPITLAVFNPEYGTSYAPEYGKRISFVSPSIRDATIIIEGVGFADIGSYTCKVATFPLGNTQASTFVNVSVEPKVYVSAGPAALLDGGDEALVATCIAERGRPAAEVFWEAELYGRSEKQTQEEVNGTTTVRINYMWKPQSYAQGKMLTCVVRHPTLQTEFRIRYKLNVQFAPNISIQGIDKIWYVGQTNVRITCTAKANPPAHDYKWIRLDGAMPEGVKISNNSLSFTRPLERNDSAIYRCEVTNDIDRSTHNVNFWVQVSLPLSPLTLQPFFNHLFLVQVIKLTSKYTTHSQSLLAGSSHYIPLLLLRFQAVIFPCIPVFVRFVLHFFIKHFSSTCCPCLSAFESNAPAAPLLPHDSNTQLLQTSQQQLASGGTEHLLSSL